MRIHAIRLTVLALTLISAVTPRLLRAGDWPQWLGPTRNDVSSETLQPWTGQPKVVWKQPVGSGFSVPVIADGILYVHAPVANEDAEEVIALRLDDGEVLWRDQSPRAPYRSELGSGPRATPTVSAGRLYTMGITGVMTCYDAKTGKRVWQTNPYDELTAARPNFGVCSSPLVVGQRIILPVGGDGSGIVGYDAATGTIAWKALDEPAASASPVLLTRGTGDQARQEVVVQTTLRLAGVSPTDGHIYWEHPLVFEPSGVSPTPLASGNILVCSTQDNGTLALQLPTEAGAAPTVAWWNQEFASYFSTGTVGHDGKVLIVTNSLSPLPRADLRCVNSQDGSEVWIKVALGYFHIGPIFLNDGKLLILDDAGNLSLAEGNGTQYKELCKSKVCGGTFVNPLLSNGRVYVRDRSQVICLDPSASEPETAEAENPK